MWQKPNTTPPELLVKNTALIKGINPAASDRTYSSMCLAVKHPAPAGSASVPLRLVPVRLLKSCGEQKSSRRACCTPPCAFRQLPGWEDELTCETRCCWNDTLLHNVCTLSAFCQRRSLWVRAGPIRQMTGASWATSPQLEQCHLASCFQVVDLSRTAATWCLGVYMLRKSNVQFLYTVPSLTKSELPDSSCDWLQQTPVDLDSRKNRV